MKVTVAQYASQNKITRAASRNRLEKLVIERKATKKTVMDVVDSTAFCGKSRYRPVTEYTILEELP